MQLRSAFSPHEVHFATTDLNAAEQRGIMDAHILPDCNQNRPIASLICAFVAAWIVLRVRPDVVVSTGAAPGFFCILLGRMTGAKTLWIDSVANAEQLSMCGKLSKTIAHQCLTQWEHLADDRGPLYRGAVL